MSTMLRIGTRKSALALTQSSWVADELRAAHSGLQVELVHLTTKGDKILDVALSKVGGKGLFVKEIETALLVGDIDLAVHSMKDLPTELPEGLCVGAVPAREDARDALVLPANGDACRGEGELPLPSGAVVGTSSLRRQAQLLHLRPDLQVADLRGNVDTRLRKLDEGQYDAIILAAAGLRRLGRTERISQPLGAPTWLSAVGQGALALEVRSDDGDTRSLLEPLNDASASACVVAERALLARLEGGCQVPLGAHASLEGGTLSLSGFVADPDGARLVRDSVGGAVEEAESLGEDLAEALLKSGGQEILAALRESSEEDAID